jgi:hypothetical protein
MREFCTLRHVSYGEANFIVWLVDVLLAWQHGIFGRDLLVISILHPFSPHLALGNSTAGGSGKKAY